VGTSVVLSPAAWIDYATVFPNLLGGSADYATNLAPATLVERAGAGATLGGAVRLALLAAAVAMTLAAPLVAWRHPGMHGRAAGVTLATAAMLLLPAATWYHYLAALLPVAALAWPAAGLRWRLALLAAAALVTVGVAVLPLATIGAALLLAVAATIQLRAARGITRAAAPVPAIGRDGGAPAATTLP
jgi:hypothetical protein